MTCQLCKLYFTTDGLLVKHVNVVHNGNWNGIEREWVGPDGSKPESTFVIEEEP